MAENEPADVLPAWATQILILLWLLLFGGRSLLAPLLQYTGMLAPAQLELLDETILLRLYLVLLAVTCVVAALRAVRRAQSAQSAQVANTAQPAAHEPCATQAEVSGPATSAGGDQAVD